MRPDEFAGMSMYCCWAIDFSVPLKLQKTALLAKRPLVLLMILTSSTFFAAGIAAVFPQKEAGGAPEPAAATTSAACPSDGAGAARATPTATPASVAASAAATANVRADERSFIGCSLACGCLGRAHTRPVSYTHLRAHETRHDLVCRL